MRRTTTKPKEPTAVQRKAAVAKFDEATELCGKLLAGLHYLEDREDDNRPVDADVCDEIVRTLRRVSQSELLAPMIGYLLLRMRAEPGKEPPPSEDGGDELDAYRALHYRITRRLDEADNRVRGPARH